MEWRGEEDDVTPPSTSPGLSLTRCLFVASSIYSNQGGQGGRGNYMKGNTIRMVANPSLYVNLFV